MKKNNTRIYAILMMVVLLFSSVNITSFAASGIGKQEVMSRKAAQIALYQNGDLSAAYDGNDSYETAASYEEGTAEYILYNGFKSFQKEIDLTELSIDAEEAAEIYRQVINSNPDLFYVTNYLQYRYYEDGTLAWFEPTYIGTADQLSGMVTEFEQAVEKALSGIHEDMSDLEKALYLHDYLIKLNAYDHENFAKGEEYVPATGHSAYGCLVLNISVCDGYSLAYSYLLQQVGIECRLITGPGHAWNAVVLNEKEYFVDLTWDDPDINGWGDCYDHVGHSYFLLNGDELKADGSESHSTWDQNVNPTDTTYSLAAFRNVRVQYGYYKDNWYYLDRDNAVIRKTADPVESGSAFYSLSDIIWYAVGSNGYWPGYHGSVDVSENNGKVYFNTADSIKSIDLNKKDATPETVHTIDTTNGYIYGFNIIGDTLTYGISKSPNEKETTYTTSIKEDKKYATGMEIKADAEQTEYDFLYTGETYQLTAIPTDEGENYVLPEDATWSSNDSNIATIDENGLLTAKGIGTAIITATSDTLSDTFEIQIKPEVTGLIGSNEISIEKDATSMITILPENDTTLRPSDIIWLLPEDETIIKQASMDHILDNIPKDTLAIEGVSGGTEKITVQFKDLTYVFNISVLVTLSDFSFTQTEITLGAGSTHTAKLIYNPSDTYPIPEASWRSSDETIATVDSNGVITAVGLGDVNIICTIGDLEHSITVHVVDVIIGDVNGDTNIDANDALSVLKRVAHMNVSEFNEAAADCDNNNSIDANDALWILKKVAHMI